MEDKSGGYSSVRIRRLKSPNLCNHKHLRKSYPFGRESDARVSCRDCGTPMKKMELKGRKEAQEKRGKRDNKKFIRRKEK